MKVMLSLVMAAVSQLVATTAQNDPMCVKRGIRAFGFNNTGTNYSDYDYLVRTESPEFVYRL